MQQHLGENMVKITHGLSQNKPNEEPSCCHPWQLPQCMNTSAFSRSSFRETVMSACLEMCLDAECISLNPLALFKPFCLNTRADCLEKLAFLLPCFYRAHYFWKGMCVCAFYYFHLSLQLVREKICWLQNEKFAGAGLSATATTGSVENREQNWDISSVIYSNSKFCIWFY